MNNVSYFASALFTRPLKKVVNDVVNDVKQNSCCKFLLRVTAEVITSSVQKQTLLFARHVNILNIQIILRTILTLC